MYKERRRKLNRQSFISSNPVFAVFCAVISGGGVALYSCSFQGGCISKCKVESGKWKVNPFLLGRGGCRVATGGVTLSQCKVESGKWKVNPFLLGRGGSRAARDVNPPQTGRMSRVVNPRSDRRGESTRDGIITSFPLQRGGLGWGLTRRETWRATSC